MRSAALSIAIVLCLALPSATLAQGARLSGRVTDEAGEPLADVEAKLVDLETGAEVSQTSNRKGRFNLTVLHPDHPYEIVLTKQGFVQLREPIELERGEPVRGSWALVAGPTGVPELDMTEEELAAKQRAIDLYNEGAQAYNAGDLDTAAARFDAAIAADPDLAEAYEIAAALNQQLGNHERVLELARATLERDPDNLRAMNLRYDALNALGSPEADSALDHLIEVVPDDETAKRAYNRGLAHAKSADVEAAVPRLEQAVSIGPGLAPAWGLLGDLEIARGNLQRALECADRLLAIEGSRERGLSLRHRAYEAMGAEEEAAAALRQLAEVNPEAVLKSLFERGNDLFDNNEPAAAAEIYRQVLELQPDNARAHYKLGLALLSSSDLTNARLHLERFLELAPDDPEAAAARDMLSYLE